MIAENVGRLRNDAPFSLACLHINTRSWGSVSKADGPTSTKRMDIPPKPNTSGDPPRPIFHQKTKNSCNASHLAQRGSKQEKDRCGT